MSIGFGIDFGGTGIKGAPVDLASGAFAGERVRIKTPSPSTPEAVADVVAQVITQGSVEAGLVVDPNAPVGITVPGVVRHGVVRSAANIDRSWIGTHADALLSARLERPVRVVNDADAAGLAEVRYGAAKDRSGLVIVTTLGTGIGSALVYDGTLLPHTELGHLEVDGVEAELRASNRARENEELSWHDWAARLTRYYRTLEALFSPELFVIGGGVSKHFDEFGPLIHVEADVIPATLRNKAGVIGAALYAAEARH